MDNFYNYEEVPIVEGLDKLKTLTDIPIRSIPQVVINGEYVGGFAEVENFIKRFPDH